MTDFPALASKIDLIRSHFADAVGSRIVSYGTAELLRDDGTWDAWPDLPIRLRMDTGLLIAVAWAKFDHLWMAGDGTLPFSVEGSVVRWVQNGVAKINPVLGSVVHSVRLGRGEMSVEGRDVEIWTRLLIQVGNWWLEVFNALDENGYELHSQLPLCDSVPCA